MTKVIVRHNVKASLPRKAMDGKKYKKLHTDRDWKRSCQRICEHNGLEGYAEPKTVCTAFSNGQLMLPRTIRRWLNSLHLQSAVKQSSHIHSWLSLHRDPMKFHMYHA